MVDTDITQTVDDTATEAPAAAAEASPSGDAKADERHPEPVEGPALSPSQDEAEGPVLSEVEGLRQVLLDKERLLASLEEELERGEAENRRLRDEVERLRDEGERAQALAQDALARYRERLLASAPEVPEEMVKGQTVEELHSSLANAQDLVERVRRQLLAQSAAQRVPSGAPIRRGPDLSTLSPAEKISLGLGSPNP